MSDSERDERTDEFLNEQDWPTVSGYSFSPADILFEFDYTAYCEIELDLHDADCQEGRHVVTDMNSCDYCGQQVEENDDDEDGAWSPRESA